MAYYPSKYIKSKDLSCTVISKEYPFPIITCQCGPYFLSIYSLTKPAEPYFENVSDFDNMNLTEIPIFFNYPMAAST